MKPQTNADERGLDLDEMTERIIGCAFRVSNVLGCGLLEKVYENALAHELRRNEIDFQQQARILVRYESVVVGDYIAEIVVAEAVLIEVKACTGSDDIHKAQCLNYLRATGMRVCLLINFGRDQANRSRMLKAESIRVHLRSSAVPIRFCLPCR